MSIYHLIFLLLFTLLPKRSTYTEAVNDNLIHSCKSCKEQSHYYLNLCSIDTFPKDKNYFIEADQPLNPRNTQVFFKDSQFKKLVKSLDLRELNPYKNLPYPIDYMSEDSLEYRYNLSKTDSNIKNQILDELNVHKNTMRDHEYLGAFVKTPVVEIQDNKLAIAYHITYSDGNENILGTQGYALFFNKTGDETLRLQDKEFGFYDIRLSTDSKCLMQKYGTDYGEDGSGQLERGFKFYDTGTGKILFEWKLGKDQFLDGFDFIPNTNYHTNFYRTEGLVHEYYLIDVLSKAVYKKTMNRHRYSNDSTGYRNSLFPNYRTTREINDLIKDGFQKIN
jgi:hypothetical protein